jgi:DhnA family fructose-bisphosphate aldolase class Ia
VRSEDQQLLMETRFTNPAAIATLAKDRQLRSSLNGSSRLLIIAADHAARGVLNAGNHEDAMWSRYDLLDRLMTALIIPGVDGVLGTPDVIEDLLILRALEDKFVFGSMNRGGLPGAVFELDDRFTGYTPQSIVESRLDGGKMLLRINYEDPGTVTTLAACADAVTQLAASSKVAMLEPFLNQLVNGKPKNVLTTEAIIRSMAIASALGATSAYNWLKIPVLEEMERVVEASTLPIVLLGGERSEQPDELFARWERALKLPGVRGLVVGRNLLYPPDNDVAAAVKTALSLL